MGKITKEVISKNDETVSSSKKNSRLSALSILTLIASLAFVLIYAIIMLLLAHELIVPVLIFMIGMLIVSGLLLFTRARFIPLFGALLALAGILGNFDRISYDLVHPAMIEFTTSVLTTTVEIIGIAAGIGATLQNYMSTQRRMPRWFMLILSGLIGLSLGAILVAQIPQPQSSQTTGGASTALAIVHMSPDSFLQSSVRLKKGGTVQLVDDGSFLHVIANGFWVNGSGKTAQETGMPVVSNVQVNGNTIQIGPFNTSGTFHLFCTIHSGMNLTVIVQ